MVLNVLRVLQISQLFKLGSQCYEDMKQFSCAIEEALFRLLAHRDRALSYKMEEVQITVVDELYVEQNAEGHVEKQIARVRLFFLGFLTGKRPKYDFLLFLVIFSAYLLCNILVYLDPM